MGTYEPMLPRYKKSHNRSNESIGLHCLNNVNFRSDALHSILNSPTSL